jgi:hypothetical protein
MRNKNINPRRTMTKTKSHLTPPQAHFASQLTDSAYSWVKIPTYRDSRVAFRAVRKLGLRGEYSGGFMLVIRGPESPITKLARRTLFKVLGERIFDWMEEQKREKAERVAHLLRFAPELTTYVANFPYKPWRPSALPR